jgi:hypothetical protein
MQPLGADRRPLSTIVASEKKKKGQQAFPSFSFVAQRWIGPALRDVFAPLLLV